MMLWLISEGAAEMVDSAVAAGWQPTAAQEAEVEARVEALRTGSTPRMLQVSGKVARINVEGALTEKPSAFAWLFGSGGSSYQEIVAAVKAAENDPEVTAVEWSISSPGGQVQGLFEALAEIQAAKKPRSVVASQANSAAYAIASVVGKIEATSPAATFGSIGVMATLIPAAGRITMRSTAAPMKNPDPSTEEGKAQVQAYLDGMHELFVEAVATGRSVSTETINATFGRGASLLAREALSRGMIDSVRTQPLRVVGGASKTKASAEIGGAVIKENRMDLNTLKAQHPDLAAALVQEGVTKERERVAAHLEMASNFGGALPQAGCLGVAVEAIKGGIDFNHAPTLAKYLSASKNASDAANRIADDKETQEAVNKAAAKDRDLGDLLAEEMLGKETA